MAVDVATAEMEGNDSRSLMVEHDREHGKGLFFRSRGGNYSLDERACRLREFAARKFLDDGQRFRSFGRLKTSGET